MSIYSQASREWKDKVFIVKWRDKIRVTPRVGRKIGLTTQPLNPKTACAIIQ